MSVQADSDGNVYSLGEFSGSVTFDGPGGTHTGTTDGSVFNLFLTKRSDTGAYLWTKTLKLSGGGNVTPARLAVDGSDNLYFTGTSTGTISFENFGSSDSVSTEIGAVDTFVTKLNADGSYGWTRHTIAADVGDFAESTAMTLDHSGKPIIAGTVTGTVNFDQTGDDSHSSGVGATQDVFVTEFDADGNYQWTFTTNSSSGAPLVSSIATLWGSDTIILGGAYNHTTTFDGPGGTDTHTATVHDIANMYLLALNPDGSYNSTFFMDQSQGDVLLTSIAVDWNNDLYLTGGFIGTVTFDGTGGTDSITAPDAGAIDPFLTHMSWDGSTYYWTKIMDNDAGEGLTGALTTDWWGNVYVAGYFDGTLGFDGAGGNDTQTTAADSTTFVSSWDHYGNYRYTQTIGASSGSRNSINLGSITTYRDTLYVAGVYFGSATFDGPGGTDTKTAGSADGEGYLSSWRTGPPLATNDNEQVVTLTSPANGHTISGSSVHVTGTSASNVHVAVQVDGQTKQTVLTDSSGHFTADLTGLSSGSHTITASFVTSHAIAYMSDRSNGTIHVVDIIDRTALATFSPPDNEYVISVAVSPQGTILESTTGTTCSVDSVNSQTNTTTALASDASSSGYCEFTGIAFSADGHTAYVGEFSYPDQQAYIKVIDLKTGHITSHNITGTSPFVSGVALNPDGSELWITNGNMIVIYDSSDLSPKGIVDDGSPDLSNNIVFANHKAYVGDAGSGVVRVMNDDDNIHAELATMSHGASNAYTNLAATPDGAYIYALDPYTNRGSAIDIFRTSDDSFVKEIITQQPGESIAIAPDAAGHLVVGDDHSSGEIYFGTSQNQTLTDGLVFENGSFGTLNSDFLLPAGTHTFSDSVRISVTTASSGDKAGAETATTSDETDSESTPATPTDTSTGPPSSNPQTDRTTPGSMVSFSLIAYSAGAIIGLLLLILLFRRRRHDSEKVQG